MGGELMRRCTSRAPALKSMSTSLLVVLPRTMESSTTTSRLPEMTVRMGLSFMRRPSWRRWSSGWMKVR